MASDKANHRGLVLEVFADRRYLIRFDNGQELKCYLSGKMSFNKIRVIAGDRVEIFLPAGGEIGRVLKRL